MANITIRFISQTGMSVNHLFDSNNPQTILFGRSVNCAVSFADESKISSEHAQISINENGNLNIVDLNSTNGTFINGNKILPNQPYQINRGDDVYFALSRLIELKFDAGNNEEIGEKDNRILELLASSKTIIIGRASECDYKINHPSISRRHASISEIPDSPSNALSKHLLENPKS